jgi:hypothetical protein
VSEKKHAGDRPAAATAGPYPLPTPHSYAGHGGRHGCGVFTTSPASSPRAVHGCYVTGSRAGARATRVNARRPAAGSPSARHARDLTCGSPARSPMEYGPRPHRPIDPGPGPPPRRARRLLRPLRKPVCRRARALNAAPGGTYVSAPAVWSLAGLRRACTMHHALGPRPSLARCLSQLVASCALSSAQLAGPWPGGVARACKHQSVAAPCHASFCFAPGPVVLQRSRVQCSAGSHGMAWHVRQAACSAQWCVPVRCMPGCLPGQ